MTNRLAEMAAAIAAEEIQQCDDTIAFLAARMSIRSWREPRCTGISSDALTVHGIGGAEPRPGAYPADLDDLAACERTWLMAPDDVRARMLPVLERYRAHVADRWAS